jgi:hypothetical protein
MYILVYLTTYKKLDILCTQMSMHVAKRIFSAHQKCNGHSKERNLSIFIIIRLSHTDQCH